ncbi:hypothetical protein KI387_042843, partial [Taxus chinensis]
EKEDEFEKVSVGKEYVGERTYMREIMDTGPKIKSYNSLPSSLKELKRAGRDPHGNHYAARARLEEDYEEVSTVHPDSEMVDNLSLDWSNEDDDMINTQAFNEFSQHMKPSALVQVEDSAELPNLVTFIPRKRALCSNNKTRDDSNNTNNSQNTIEDSSENSSQLVILPLGIAAGQATETKSPTLDNDVGESKRLVSINKNSIRIHKGT